LGNLGRIIARRPNHRGIIQKDEDLLTETGKRVNAFGEKGSWITTAKENSGLPRKRVQQPRSYIPLGEKNLKSAKKRKGKDHLEESSWKKRYEGQASQKGANGPSMTKTLWGLERRQKVFRGGGPTKVQLQKQRKFCQLWGKLVPRAGEKKKINLCVD